MPRQMTAAAIQMDATPAPTAERLARASDLIAQAAAQGAQLIALPEVFNTGYRYTDENYRRAEPIDGPTVQWMRAQAAEHGVHVAGTLFLLDHDEVYNAALLIAPDGMMWRYNKHYPWGWERAYYREGQDITIADTELGKIGMMICWDYSHNDLWQRYAGRVDMMLILSSPPAVDALEIVFPDGTRSVNAPKTFYRGEDKAFGTDMDALARWMRVPVVNTAAAGRFESPVPQTRLSLLGGLLLSPRMLPRTFGDLSSVRIEADYHAQTKVINAEGIVLARVSENSDGIAVAEIELGDHAPIPTEPQPQSAYRFLAYFLSDVLLPAITIPLYRKGYRDVHGEGMAPRDSRTKVWVGVVLFAFLLGLSMRDDESTVNARKGR